MRRTWKKVICVAVSAVMIFAMSATAFAADSPSASGVITAGKGVDKNGKEVHYSVGAYSGNFAAAVAKIREAGGLKAAMGNAYTEGLKLVDVQAVNVEGIETSEYPITLTFNAPGITTGSKVSVMSYVNGQWVVLQCTAGDGTITATFENADQLAAVSFAADKSTTIESPDKKTPVGTTGNSTASNNTSASNATSGAVSPKTGENSVVPMAVIAMMLMVGGSLCLRKREVR